MMDNRMLVVSVVTSCNAMAGSTALLPSRAGCVIAGDLAMARSRLQPAQVKIEPKVRIAPMASANLAPRPQQYRESGNR